jgi:acetolactate synthase I/II/III large subunit
VTSQDLAFPGVGSSARRLIHVHQDPAVIGRVFSPRLGIVADPVSFLKRLSNQQANPDVRQRHQSWCKELNSRACSLQAPTVRTPHDGVDFGAVVAAFCKAADEDAIVAMDTGNFSSWVHRHWVWTGEQQLLACGAGAMGFGVPAAIAAQLRHPGRQVLTFVGDGGFLMSGNELSAAASRRLPVKIIISNNRSYGTIRLHQEKTFPGRVSATDLPEHDLSHIGKAFGAWTANIRTPDQIDETVRRALRVSEPVLIDVRSSLTALSATSSIAADGGLRRV